MKRPKAQFLSVAVLVSLGIGACSTPQRRPRGPMQSPIEKEGQKVPDGEIHVSQGSGPAVPPDSASAADISGLWSRVNNTQVTLTEEDLMKATQLYPTQSNSLEEATFVVTQLRILKSEWEKKTSFQTQDLHTQQTADHTAGLSLENTFGELQVDLASAIKNNPHLKNHESLLLTKQLLASTKNSDSYRAGIIAALKESGATWPDIVADDLPPSGAADSPAVDAAIPPPTTEAPASEAANPASGSLAPAASNLDLMGSDTLLIAAQKLADKRDYKGALEHVTRIKPEDPFYAQAQEKQKQYSNRAVKDLRTKAAEAFSNATPLNDSNAKANYLKQAKMYLEQAINDFPVADGLDSAKENLEAVNRGLDALDKSGT